MSGSDSSSSPRLAKWLIGVFAVALVMGPGPGVHLVNPSSKEDAFWFGIPVLYLWSVFWFAVMALAVGIAYAKVWTDDGKEKGERRR